MQVKPEIIWLDDTPGYLFRLNHKLSGREMSTLLNVMLAPFSIIMLPSTMLTANLIREQLLADNFSMAPDIQHPAQSQGTKD